MGVSKDTMIIELVDRYPGSVKIMEKFGLHCVGCHVATWETIEQGAQAHGIDPGQIVSEINKHIS